VLAVSVAGLSAEVGRKADWTQDQLAEQAHTAERASSVSRLDGDACSRITFHSVVGARGRVHQVPDQLPSLPVETALATVELPLSLNWSQPGRKYCLMDRSDRARVYEAVLREGGAGDVLALIDGSLLIDLWDELVLPGDVRAAWRPLISELNIM
jgi:hypothetical protein